MTPGETISDISRRVSEQGFERVVVVGHGPSCLRKAWGREIDRYPVIRMKSPEWQFNMRGDYGTRTDYLVFSNETAGKHANALVKPREFWVQTKKDKLTCMKLLEKKGIGYRVPMKTFHDWNEVFKEMWDHGVRNFSLGNFAVLGALKFLKARNLWLVGFDNLLHPEMAAYYKADRGKWVTGHNWKAENEFLHLLMEHYRASCTTAP